MTEKISLEDGSEKEVPEHYIDCVGKKYGIDWHTYFNEVLPLINDLWVRGKVRTKFGEERIEDKIEDFDFDITNRAGHALACIYSDLRACLMQKMFEQLGGGVKVIGVNEDGISVYDEDEVPKEYDSVEGFLEEEEDDESSTS